MLSSLLCTTYVALGVLALLHPDGSTLAGAAVLLAGIAGALVHHRRRPATPVPGRRLRPVAPGPVRASRAG